MAVILIESFDHYSTGAFDEKGWSGTPFASTTGRSGSGKGVNVFPFNPLQKQLPGSYDTLIVGAGIRLHPTIHYFLTLKASGAVVARIGVSADLRLILEDASGTVVGTGTTILPTGSWFYVEAKIEVAAGRGEVHLNGLTEIASTSGIDFGAANMTQLELGQETGLFDGSTDFDDIYVLDTTGTSPENDFLGDVVVRTFTPSADGTHTDWIPDSGTDHYARVDENSIDGDTSYVHSDTVGAKDSYDVPSLAVGATIIAVQLNLGMRKNEAGPRTIKPLVRQGGADYLGPESGLSTDYLFYSWLLSKDPTGANWTAANFNADEYGVELAS